LSIVEQICDLVDEMRPDPKLTPRRRLIEFVKDRPGHDRRYAMDIAKISRELGWQPRHSLNDGLRATVEWFLTHPEWVTAIHEGQDYQSWMDKNYTKREETL
jgi:dTDP-glucose 4,6-dehydratase